MEDSMCNTNDTVKKMQAHIMEILCDIDDFCVRNDICYFLSGGTLLGAIRHKGFIPWDDDGDIMLPREDYEKFFSMFPEEYGDKYGIGEISIDKDWILPYGIVWSKDTVLKSTNLYSTDVGAGVDVFPIDGLSSNRILRHIYFERIKILNGLRNACLRKAFLDGERNRLLKKIVAAAVKPIGARRIAERMDSLSKKRKITGSTYVGSSVAAHYGEKETMDIASISNALRTAFGDTELSIPVGYEQYLTNIYGDYMIIPKEAKSKGTTHLDHWEVHFTEE